ncbi:Helix-turn-helix domain-containing protein [Paracoccus pantotrophus]|nr:Helix-turn-helix domain-containing protein [Paracoccus pantotrophus]
MSAVWEIEGIDSSECLVLMALADHADDAGRCYPSVGRLAKRTKLSDRGVQKVISRLIEKGFVRVVPAAGQGGANVYIVTATPEPRSPLNDVHPRTTGTTPLNDVRKTPEPRSPKPSRTTIEPSESVVARAPSFDEFWATWPLAKNAKDTAKRAWSKLSPERRKLATDRAVAWCATWRAANPRLNDIHPSTYLNNKRWEDEASSSLAIIPGGPREQSPQQNHQPSRDNREAAASDRFGRILDAAVRNRAPSRGDFGFG